MSFKSDQKPEGVLITAYKNRDGNLSVLFVNNSKEPVTVNVSIDNFDKNGSYYFYQVTEALTKEPGFELNPQKTIKESVKTKVVLLLPESISVLSTLNLKQKDAGIIE